jgi:hypothetical protein
MIMRGMGNSGVLQVPAIDGLFGRQPPGEVEPRANQPAEVIDKARMAATIYFS